MTRLYLKFVRMVSVSVSIKNILHVTIGLDRLHDLEPIQLCNYSPSFACHMGPCRELSCFQLGRDSVVRSLILSIL